MSEATKNGADIIVDYLAQEGITHLFGVCGHGNIGFLDAAYKASNRVRTISVHHEQSAGYMADAYYKIRHQPAATFTSCGPGSANLVVALAAAMMDSSAYIAITGNVPTQQFNRSPFQETGRFYQGDFPSVIRSYVKRSFQPTRTDMVPLAMQQALQLMRTGRPGPVNVDVPLNVFVEEARVEMPALAPKTRDRSPGDPAAIEKALEMLLGAERPVIIAGQGVLLSEASAALTQFAEAARIPVATSPNGKGSIDERHELALGSIGRNGAYAANEATRNADVILSLGFSFDDRATSAWIDGVTLAIPPSRLIQVDIDPSEIGRNYTPTLALLADARAALEALTARARATLTGRNERTAGWLDKLGRDRALWQAYQSPFGDSAQMPLRPERVVRALSRAVPDDAILACDVGVHHNWVIQLFDIVRPRQLIQSWGYAAMGFATSGILGAKVAAPQRPCIAVVGDGSFLMTPHVLATAVEYDIPVVWLIWNNYGYCSIRDMQVGLFGGRELATNFQKDASGELYNPDFAMLAKAFGVESARITAAGELEDALAHAIAANRPYLIEMPVDREIRPIGTGSWALPPLANPVPNFLDAARARGLVPGA